MPANAVLESETGLDRTVLTELTHWVKTLKEVGVSPDTAAQLATKFFMSAWEAGEEECWEEHDEEDEEEEE